MAIINDTDLLVVQNTDGDNYTYSGAQLKADMNEVGGGGGSSTTPNLDQVCKVGATTSVAVGMTNGLSVGIPNGTANVALGVDGQLSVAHAANFAKGVIVAGNIRGDLDILGNTMHCLSAFDGPSGFAIAADGGIKSLTSYLSNPGGKEMMCNGSGFIGTKPTFRRSVATNITPVDTSNFIAVLKAVNLNRADLALADETRPEIGLFVEDLQATSVSSMLTHYDGNSVEFSSTNYEHFLFGVCKQQQELIENLTTRIEQLEADHASAMNNMEDSNGSNTY